MTSTQRQPAGTPTGGQFAATGHTEADEVRLDTDLLDVEIDEAAVCSDHGIPLVEGCYECDPDDYDAEGIRLSDEDADTRDVLRRIVAMKTDGLYESLTDSADADRLRELDRSHPGGERELAVASMRLYRRSLAEIAGDAEPDPDARISDLRAMRDRLDHELAEAGRARIASATLDRFPTASAIAVTNGSLRDDVMAPKFVFDHQGEVIGDVAATEEWRSAVAGDLEDFGRTDAGGEMLDRGSLVVLDTDLAGARIMERTAALGSAGTIGNYRILPVSR